MKCQVAQPEIAHYSYHTVGRAARMPLEGMSVALSSTEADCKCLNYFVSRYAPVACVHKRATLIGFDGCFGGIFVLSLFIY